MSTTTTTPHRPSRGLLSTRDLLSCAAIGVAASVLLVPAVWWQTVAMAAAPFLAMVLTGASLAAPTLAQRLLQRGGVALVTCLVMAVLAAVTTPRGPAALIPLVTLGLVFEAAFAVTGYRRFPTWRWFAVATVIVAIQIPSSWVALDAGSLNVAAQALLVVSTVVSIFFFVALGLMLGKRLEQAGVGRRVARR